MSGGDTEFGAISKQGSMSRRRQEKGQIDMAGNFDDASWFSGPDLLVTFPVFHAKVSAEWKGEG